MKKSMIAAAVAATAFAATANAGFWSLSGMNYQNGGVPQTIGTGNGTMGNNQITPPSVAGATANTLSVDATISSVLGTLSITLADDTLTYFGFDGGAAGPGYFGIAYKASASGGVGLNFSSGVNAGGGTQGVLATQATSNFGGNGSFGGFGDFSGNFIVADSTTLVVLYGGFAAGDGFTLDVTRTSGAAGFAISYLTFNGASYNQFASAASATKSGLNTALYAIPVPAPALLAGAGLVGAAALRRRMAKKA